MENFLYNVEVDWLADLARQAAPAKKRKER